MNSEALCSISPAWPDEKVARWFKAMMVPPQRPMKSDGGGQPCAYCGQRLVSSWRAHHESLRSDPHALPVTASRDHMVPRVFGGSVRVWCCRRCNWLKDDMTFRQWLEFMALVPHYHAVFAHSAVRGRDLHRLVTEGM